MNKNLNLCWLTQCKPLNHVIIINCFGLWFLWTISYTLCVIFLSVVFRIVGLCSGTNANGKASLPACCRTKTIVCYFNELQCVK